MLVATCTCSQSYPAMAVQQYVLKLYLLLRPIFLFVNGELETVSKIFDYNQRSTLNWPLIVTFGRSVTTLLIHMAQY